MDYIYINPRYSLYKEALHFWTVLLASLLEFLLFSVIYWLILAEIKCHRKWKSSLARNSILCPAVVLVVLVSSVMGWKLPWIRRLLLEVMNKVISRFEEGTNNKPRSCYCSFQYIFRYAVYTLRMSLPLKMSPRVVKDCWTKIQLHRCLSPMVLVEKNLDQHQENH